MTDRPIIFSAPMVRALLEGRKTQTRRVVKRHGYEFFTERGVDRYREVDRYGNLTGGGLMPDPSFAPYAVGDRLWVRESFWPHEGGTIRDPGSGFVVDHIDPQIEYKADRTKPGGRWKPSIHMPRWASRITLTVTGVRVQRLQDISEDDAKAEGVFKTAAGSWSAVEGYSPLAGPTPRGGFYCLWNAIHGPGAWDANPWVAAITFTVEKRNIDQ